MNAAIPTLYHDGCRLCLDIAQTLLDTIPSLTIIDLSQNPDMKGQAELSGVSALPCLVIGNKLLPIAPHSALSDIDSDAAH